MSMREVPRKAKPVTISPVQYDWLKRIRAARSVPAEEIPLTTYRALKRRKLIEDCPRMYWGPRAHRLRLSQEGEGTLYWLEDMYGE